MYILDKNTYRDCKPPTMEAAMLDDIASFWRFLKTRLQPRFGSRENEDTRNRLPRSSSETAKGYNF